MVAYTKYDATVFGSLVQLYQFTRKKPFIAQKCNMGLRKTCITFVGFEVLTAVVMKSSVFWNTSTTPCSLLKVNGRFPGTCRPHL
jgi:hypothetical protein